MGVVRQTIVEEDSHYRMNITYNCEIVKGRDIADVIGKADENYRVRNEKVEGLTSREREVVSEQSVKQTVGLVAYFLLVNMVLPVLPLFD